MGLPQSISVAMAMGPGILMLLALLLTQVTPENSPRLWTRFQVMTCLALACSVLGILPLFGAKTELGSWLVVTPIGVLMGLVVQLLGTVIGVFSARYLEGEASQKRYIVGLSGVLAAVHWLLLADHWIILIGAWALVGVALQTLLCFYPDRPFALLAAHKKRLADRLADVMLLAAAGLSWWAVGSGSLSDLADQMAINGGSMALQASAVFLVLAVVLRTALLPVHGWLIQVMEAPTPVSALLHAGVVNLGGVVLIRSAPLLEQSALARWMLVVFGLGTAVLAGLVMLTRISIKVRLAWSTVAQMGFMVLECGLGLYTLAALHLLGHSLYKAHAFLSASSVVRDTRRHMLQGDQRPSIISLMVAPFAVIASVVMWQMLLQPGAWPWWWIGLLGLAWAPLLWLSAPVASSGRIDLRHAVLGWIGVSALTLAALVLHALPLGFKDSPHDVMGGMALLVMGLFYGFLVMLHVKPAALEAWRRRSYAGFYVDEYYTRLTLWIWPTRWTSTDASVSTPTFSALSSSPAINHVD